MIKRSKKLALLLAALLAVSSVSFPPASARAQAGQDIADTETASDLVFHDVSDGLADEEAQETDLRPATATVKLTGVLQLGDFPADEDEIDHFNAAEGMTDAAEAELESYLYQEMRDRSAEIDVSAYSLSAADSAGIIAGVINEHPDLYYVGEDLICTYDEGNDAVSTLSLTYAGGYDDAAFQAAVEDALSVVKSGMTELQKVIALHDYLVINCEYDYENYQNNTVPWASFQAYGALVNHMAVCNGYTLAYQYLLAQVGIESHYVISSSMNHAWNLVKLGGKYYHADATWDDPVADRPGLARHFYLLCSDEDFKDSEHHHYDWTVDGNLKAVSKTYDAAFWRNVEAPMVMTGKYGYYINVNDGTIRKKDFTDSSITRHGEIIYTHTASIYYSGLFMMNGRLYFNDSMSIYSIDPNASDERKDAREEFARDRSGGGSLSGIWLRDGKVYYRQGSDIKEAPWYVLGKPDPKNMIACGEIKESYGNILWGIDKKQDLIVKGTGDFAPSGGNEARAPWLKYADQILTAEIKLSGTKDASYMLFGCKNLERLDLSDFYTDKLMSVEKMLSGCDSLKEIETPFTLKTVRIELPAGPHDTWYTMSKNLKNQDSGSSLSDGGDDIWYYDEDDYNGNVNENDVWASDKSVTVITEIPQNIDKSILLQKETARISAEKGKTFYVCGEAVNADDLIVTYTPREGHNQIVMDYTTNADKIDMSKPGAKQLTVTYKDFECTVELTVLPKELLEGNKAGLYVKKTKKTYLAGEKLNMDDLSVFYCDVNGNSEEVVEYTTNEKELDMSSSGVKYLIVTCRGLSASVELTVLSNDSYYAVCYDGNGADWGTMDSQLLPRGETRELAANQYLKVGYHFDGWNTAADGSGVAYDDRGTVTDPAGRSVLTLYACWKANTYTVRFENGSKNAIGRMADQSFTYDSLAELTPNKFTRSGYNFVGWKDVKGVTYRDKQPVANMTMADGGEVVLTAQWMGGYVINYVLGDGAVNSCDNPLIYNNMAIPTPLKAPLRPGYEFAGWYTDKSFKKPLPDNAIPANSFAAITLYAKWNPKKVTVEFEANKPIGAPAEFSVKGTMKSQTIKYGSKTKLRKAAYKLTGYTFTGWNTRADGSGAAYDNNALADLTLLDMDSPATLYAQWKPVQYKITYSGATDGKNDVTNALPVTYNVESGNISLNTLNGSAYEPVRPGYTFAGWYKNSGKKKKAGDEIDVSSAKNVTVYAKWTPRKTKVTYDPNLSAAMTGVARGSMADQSLTYTAGKTKTLAAAKYTAGGYVFTGWNTDPKGHGTHYNDKAGIGLSFFTEHGETVTLYAQWQQYAYKITYQNAVVGKNDVSGNDNPPGHNGEERIVLKDPVRDGYRFEGWYLGKKQLENNILSNPGNKNVTLTAKWKGYTATITYDSNRPTNAPEAKGRMATKSVTYGTTKKLPTVGYKITGYSFLGWSKVKEPGADDPIYANKASVTLDLVEKDGNELTLYAQWKPVEYKITYVDATVGKNGVLRNNNPTAYTMENGVITSGGRTGENALALKPPTRTGYIFAGWYTDKKLKNPLTVYDTSAKKKVTFYAKWIASTYTIIYDANGGIGDPVIQTVVYDKSNKLLPRRFERQGKTFYGWSTVKDAKKGDPIYADQASVKNLTSGSRVVLYAQWK